MQMDEKMMKKMADTIRFLAADMIQKANSGHPGAPMGLADIAVVLSQHLRHNPKNPKWLNRDRLVFSGGHATGLIYSLLYLWGYDLTMDDLKRFRQLGSKTPGHPEYGHTPGVEITTGPLGQGVANAVGMAMASRYCANLVNSETAKIIDHLSSGATVVVQEGETVELVCNVTGVPHPTVTWFRIPTGLMHESDRTLEADRRKKRESRTGGLLGDPLALTVTSRSDLIDLVSHFG